MPDGKLDIDRDLLKGAMELAPELGAKYADVRAETYVSEMAQAENGVVKNVAKGAGTTLGVRALAGGTWGFASMDVADEDGLKGVIDDCTARAVRHAKAQAAFLEIKLAKVRPVRKWVKAKVAKEPVDLKAKIRLVKEITSAAHAMDTVGMALAEVHHVDSTAHF